MRDEADKLPQWLKDNARFCVRKWKVPYNPKTGTGAKVNDASTFGSYQEAISAIENSPGRYNGLGIGLFDDLVGIDIDHCVDDDGDLNDIARDILDRINSYAEWSPSGRGIHILCRASQLNYDSRRYYTKNSKLGIEIYAAGKTNRYLTVTGNAINCEDINDCGDEIIEVAEKYMLRDQPETQTIDSLEEDDLDAIMSSLSDDGVLKVMFNSANGSKIQKLWEGDYSGYPSHSEADQALCNHLAFFTRKDPEQMDRLFRQSDLFRDKWDRKQSGTTYGAITIRKAIENTTSVWTPGFRPFELSTGIDAALSFLKEVDAVRNPRYQMDDIGAGYLLADYIKPFARPLYDGKKWMVYDGVRWHADDGLSTVEEAAKNMSRALQSYAAGLPETEMNIVREWAGKWTQRPKRKQFIQEAASVYPVSRNDFDRSPWFLNLNNGTLDLRTRELREHNPEDLLTQIAPVDYLPEARCERWERFIEEIMIPGDEEQTNSESRDPEEIKREKAEFLHRFLGYSLTGDTKEEVFLIAYGPTSRNGKSVCVEAVKAIMGTYAASVNAETLLRGKNRIDNGGTGPTENLARLDGIRMASVGEIPQGTRLDAALVKKLTGGDTINARFLGENSFEFTSQFKLILHTNHLPDCSDMSVFASGRVLVLPFSRHFEEHEQDKSLKQLFREPENQSGILNWLIEGLSEYLKQGLNPPNAVRKATDMYHTDNDKTGRFISECLIPDEKGKITVVTLYDHYRTWCTNNGYQYIENRRAFVHNLEEKNIRTTKARPYLGANPTTIITGYNLNPEVDKYS